MRTRIWMLVLLTLFSSLSLRAQSQKNPPRKKPAAVSAEEINELRKLVAAQGKQIEELKALVANVVAANEKAAAEAREAAESAQQAQELSRRADGLAQNAQAAAISSQSDARHAESAAAEAKTAVVQQEGHWAANEKHLSEVRDTLERFRLRGDVRVRFEPLLQDLVPDRYRTRLRVRFGAEGKLGEDLTGGFAIATGTVNDDPVSTNATLTEFFTRKPIGLDLGYIAYRPHQFKPLQLTAGKFQQTWLRTSLTFDPDLNPEGFSEKLSFDLDHPLLKNVSLTGMELIFNEIAGTNLPLASGADSYAFGGQLSARLQFGPRITTTWGATALNWQNTNAIIQAVTARTLAGNRNTNATLGAGATIAYASKFLYIDFLADTVVQTWSERFPFRVLLDFVDNPRAASNQRHGFWGEVSLGRQRDVSDVQFGYSFGRIEQDAVISAFNESELRAPTNIIQHRLFFEWLAMKNTTALFTGWFGRTLNRDLQNAAIPPGLLAGEKDPLVKRLQFDLIYKF
jgi:hypothetical protein